MKHFGVLYHYDSLLSKRRSGVLVLGSFAMGILAVEKKVFGWLGRQHEADGVRESSRWAFVWSTACILIKWPG